MSKRTKNNQKTLTNYRQSIDNIPQMVYNKIVPRGTRKERENMEDFEKMTNGETRALLQAIRIINQEIRDPDKLDRRLKEIQEALEKGVTEADQAKR